MDWQDYLTVTAGLGLAGILIRGVFRLTSLRPRSRWPASASASGSLEHETGHGQSRSAVDDGPVIDHFENDGFAGD